MAKVKARSERYAIPSKVFSTMAIVRGFKKVRKASAWKSSTKRFKANLFVNARHESNRLLNKRWKSKGIVEFDIIERGHPRHIQNVHISEKAVQAALSNECLVPIIEPYLIYDNGDSLKGKGTDFAITRFDKHLRRHLRKYGRNGWIFFFDFEKYFDHINHKRMLEILESKALNDDIIALYKTILGEMGKPYDDNTEGLGLGSQVFQISAVFYPNALDHWVKDALGINGYAHYMDDGYAIFKDLDDLKRFKTLFYQKCKEFKIIPNKKKCQTVKLSSKFIFLKVRYKITSTLKIVKRINKGSASKERRKLKKLKSLLEENRKTFIEIKNEFHGWLCSLIRGRCFYLILRMIVYFNRMFDGYGEYTLVKPPKKSQRKKYHQLQYAIRKAKEGEA